MRLSRPRRLYRRSQTSVQSYLITVRTTSPLSKIAGAGTVVQGQFGASPSSISVGTAGAPGEQHRSLPGQAGGGLGAAPHSIPSLH